MEHKFIDSLKQLSNGLKNYVVGFEGNVSSKVGNTFLIKSSGSKLNGISDENFVLFDFDGNQLNNFDKRGSMEMEFHKFLLSFEKINYIAHTHPINCLKILCSNMSEDFANYRIFPDQVVFNHKKSCLVPYSHPGIDLAKSIETSVMKFIKKNNFFPKLILLENHGIIACGETVDECIMITEICEKSAEIFFSIYNKSPKFLTQESINNLIDDKNEHYRKTLL